MVVEYRARCSTCHLLNDCVSKPKAYAWAHEHVDDHESRDEVCQGVTIRPVVK